MQESEKQANCQFCSNTGQYCSEIDMGNGFCFWHDPNFDKKGMDLADKLERYVAKGGITQGLQLKYANLSGINLVKKNSNTGYDFSHSNFYRADLSHAHLFSIKLNHANLMKANFNEANLHCAQLEQANLLGIKLNNTKIDNIQLGKHINQEELAATLAKQKDTHKANELYLQAEQIYRDIRRAAENQGIFELASQCMYKEITMRRKQMAWFSKDRISSKILDLFCGYGEKPLNIIACSLILIFSCALAYFLFGFYQGIYLIQFNSQLSFADNFHHFLLSLYYSFLAFTTLGFDNLTPIGWSKVVTSLQAFLGSFIMALFVLVFVKKMSR
ncbi:pentapeptide repeat-containing protein [Catenovulum sp. 2E275]|uniref:pentapeptide repeat-containing protein n=1 Tax=Catenovulum sp. 2E275 TaxID=2980497 RepID=UPI0021CFD4C0|nr:pentapeptide repeat-containing protein [Catenovulum sp. 2E275]MCU4674950.1 pentapeptide repeat-containing protein [Catenovulum sp. 2E275]